MLETVTFPIGQCPNCGPNVLLAGDLDEHDQIVQVCVHCDATIPETSRRKQLGARSLERYGYLVEDEIEKKGCGTDGGGGGCGGSCGC